VRNVSERIRIMRSPVLTVNSAGNGFDEPTYTTGSAWSWNSSTGAVTSGRIDGEILRIFFKFGSGNTDNSATITITDTLTGETIYSETIDWTSSVSKIPVLAKVQSDGTAVPAGDNKWAPWPINGTVTIDCSGATDNDTVEVYIFYR